MTPQITLTLDLTPETLEFLKLLTSADKVDAGSAKSEAESFAFDDPNIGKDKAPTKKPTGKDKKTVVLKETLVEPTEPETTFKIGAETEDVIPTVSLTDVRATALKLSKAGKQATLKKIFAKYGASKLSDISVERYADLLADLEDADE